MTALEVAVIIVYRLRERDKSRRVHCYLISFSLYTWVAHCKAKWMVSTLGHHLSDIYQIRATIMWLD